MFKFTTETILNDLSKVDGVLGAATAPVSAVPWDPGIELTKKALWIKRLNKFIVGGSKDLIVGTKVYKRAATSAVLAQSRFTIPTTVVGTLYRVGVQLTTNGYADGMFARDRVTYGKPFYIELLATSVTAATSASALAAAWNSVYKSYDHFVTATVSTAALIFTANDNPYIQIKSLILESIDPVTGIATDITPTVTVNSVGTPAFGDYNDLLKNHRLPTLDNFRPFGLNQEELPVVGATYNEYAFEYQADRDVMDTSFTAGLGTSKTTHIIWVNAAAPTVTRHLSGAAGVTGAYSFDMILKVLGLSIIDAASGSDLTGAVTLPTEA